MYITIRQKRQTMRTQPQHIIERLEADNSKLAKQAIVLEAMQEGLDEFFEGDILTCSSDYNNHNTGQNFTYRYSIPTNRIASTGCEQSLHTIIPAHVWHQHAVAEHTTHKLAAPNLIKFDQKNNICRPKAAAQGKPAALSSTGNAGADSG